MPAQDSDPIVRFGAFELDLRAGELRRSGIRLPVQGRPLQVLAILLKSPGELVSSEQLRTELWPADTFVDFEHGVHNAVARLRAVLGDTADRPRFIETLPRRGYRFIGSVERAPVNPVSPVPVLAAPPVIAGPSRKHLRKTGIVLGCLLLAAVELLLYTSMLRQPAGSQITALAVLPLENLSGDRTQDYFADGITDELITALAKINSIKVISRTSVMQYKGVHKRLPDIARELGVNGVVEGTVVRSGDLVRLTAQLIYAPADRHVWAERYERNSRDILLLESEVAGAISEQLRGKLGSVEKGRLTAKSVDPDVYQLYLKGRYFWNERTDESIHKAIDYFNQAAKKDPHYAAAYSGLADSYSILGFSIDVGGMAPNDAQPKAIAAAQRAITLDDSLAEAHASLAFIKLHYQWDLPGSETEFRRAFVLNPGEANTHHWYAHYLVAAGRLSDAEAESRRALELDPLSPMMNVHLGWHYLQTRQPDRALDQLRKTLELYPNLALGYWYGGLAYEQKGMYDDAIREMGKCRQLLPGNMVVYSDIGHAYAMAGNRAGADRVLAELKQLRKRVYVSPFGVALILVGLGQKDQAFASLEEAYQERSDMLVYLNVDPRLDPIRPDPRFIALLKKIGTPP